MGEGEVCCDHMEAVEWSERVMGGGERESKKLVV